MTVNEEVMSDELDESSAPARVELERAYLHMSFAQYDEAIAACERAATRAHDHPLPATLKGSFEMAAGRVRDALGTLRRVTRRHPDDPLARVYFAEACFLSGRHRQGKRALAKAETLAQAGEANAGLAEMIEQVRQLWKDVEPSEVPPPLVVEFADASDA